MTTIDTNGALHDSLGQYATKGAPAAGYDLGDALVATAHAQQSEAAIGGPAAMSAAKAALWQTALAEDAPDLYGEEDDDGYHECYLCGTESPSGEIDAHMRNNHPQYTTGLTGDDIDPDSKATVEADFERWAAEHADAVAAFTQTVDDPDGGTPAEALGRNWWRTRNGLDGGFEDLLADDPAYVEAQREHQRRQDELGAAQIALNDAYRAAERANNASSPAEQRYAEAQARVTDATEAARAKPLDVLRAKAAAADAEWRRNYGAGYMKLHDGRSTAKTYGEAQAREDRAQAAKVAADRAVHRAEALTALAAATPVHPAYVYVGDDGLVHVD